MPTVAIPADHFIVSVKRNYSDHRQALIREFIQNSVDAGSKSINIDLDQDNRILTVSDDGCGMSREILVSALLTMSGSHKGPNSVGGFGAAKEILLFQHSKYEVTTAKDGITTAVVGSQLDYDFVDADLDQGTVVKVYLHENYGDMRILDDSIVCYLQTCEVDADVMYNGLRYGGLKRGDLVKELDWANIYVTDLGYNTNMVNVRINGISMFKEWVSETRFQVIVEITKPSLDILTVNRDGFTYQYSNQLRQLMYEISIEKNQFGKAFGEHKVWHGDSSAYNDIELFCDDILENCDQKFNEHKVKHIARWIAKVSKTFADDPAAIDNLRSEINEHQDYSDIPEELIDHMIERSKQLICGHNADFYIKVSGVGFDKIPDNLKPGNWGKRVQAWARLWKHCIRLVMRANDINGVYTIGWVIDNDENVEAMWSLVSDVNVFYMNPMLTWMRSSNHMHVFHKMLMNAAHEITHTFYQYHNENFVQKYEDMLHRTLCMINRGKNSWWKEYLASKKEII